MGVLRAIVALSGLVLPSATIGAERDLVPLGRDLFASKAISKDGQLACATCHDPASSFADGYERALSRRRMTSRNTLTTLNVNFYTSFSWDGRSSTLESQVSNTLVARHELGSDEARLRAYISGLDYTKRAEESFVAMATRAIADYLRASATTETRFLRAQNGGPPLSDRELKGFAVFKKLGCTSCHKEPHFTDNLFHDIGLPRRKIIFQTIGSSSAHGERGELGPDFGRGNIESGKDKLFRFRTPSLINVMETAPYMHDGTFRDIDEVIWFYARKDAAAGGDSILFRADEREALKSFLKTLSDVRHGG